MTTTKALLKKVSEEEYLNLEAKADTKSEYHDGEIVKMVGASESHNLIVSNLIVEIGVWPKRQRL